MIGSLHPSSTPQSVAIVGGGISGLLAAYHLKKMGHSVRVFEASNRCGGLIQTSRTNHGPVEHAAHSLMVNDELAKFFQELQIPLVPVHPKSRARYIVRNGWFFKGPRRMPLSIFELAYTVYRFFSRPKKSFDPETGTLGDWCEHYLGSPAKKFLLTPFIAGVYAATPDELNAALTFPSLVPENKSISLFQHFRLQKKSSTETHQKQKRPQMMTPLNGMESVIHALQKNLADCIQLNTPIRTVNDPVLTEFPNRIWTVPAPVLAEILKGSAPSTATALTKINYSPLVTVTAFFKKSLFKKNPTGVGVLIPRLQGFRTLGVLYNSSAFPNRATDPDELSFTFMYGGTVDRDALNLTDAELIAQIAVDAKKLWSMNDSTFKPNDFTTTLTRWKSAIPLYDDCLKNSHNALRTELCSMPGNIVFSNYSGQVSIRGLIQQLTHLTTPPGKL
jgi:oxygen-dependent protoporphyrinogen oxidase